jgi:NodT family efflux transporter outer membrane factor (OMF) lipoprotein
MPATSRCQWFRAIKYLTQLFAASAVLVGCTTLGPDFVKPEVATEESWLEKNNEISTASKEQTEWWKIFNDSALNGLVEKAYKQNLPLQIAGLRIFEARAELGIAVGLQYPQTQRVGGSSSAVGLSENSPNFDPQIEDRFRNYQAGFDASWELDFWGRFRRGIESADANLSATVADYDNALVSLTAEVARVYVNIRILEERLKIADDNIDLQKKSLYIASVRFSNGATTELDVQQAKTSLASTQAQVPGLIRQIRQTKNALSILMGIPPAELTEALGGPGTIPHALEQVAVGIPAELLRRRPDIHQAELQAASQSALIGVAETDLYPSFSLFGSIGFQTGDTGNSSGSDLFDSDSLAYSFGPTFSWNILNYGRLKNNVRVQDARYQQTIVNYQNTVLTAYQEVEDAMVGFIQAQKETAIREVGAQAARRSTEIANLQYREGATDFQRVIDTERSLVVQQDLWTQARGDISLNIIALYKALGGGWELREGQDVISDENREAMKERTNWGDLLQSQSAEKQ